MLKQEKQELISLLKRCAANDVAAQGEFANLSFLNTVHRAVLGVIDEQGVRDRLTHEDIWSLVVLCVWDGVYRQADEIVRQSNNFRESLRRVAVVITTKYLNRKLAVR